MLACPFFVCHAPLNLRARLLCGIFCGFIVSIAIVVVAVVVIAIAGGHVTFGTSHYGVALDVPVFVLCVLLFWLLLSLIS